MCLLWLMQNHLVHMCLKFWILQIVHKRIYLKNKTIFFTYLWKNFLQDSLEKKIHYKKVSRFSVIKFKKGGGLRMNLSNNINKNNFSCLASLCHPDEITGILLLNQTVPEPRSSEVYRSSCLVFCSGTGSSKGQQHQAGELQSRCVRAEANAEQNDFVLAACLTLTLLCMTQLQHQSPFSHTELLLPKGDL